MDSLVSVVMPAFKAKFIQKTVDSVLRQTYRNFEFIIVDDGSPENLRDVLKIYIDQGLVKYIHQNNQKMAAAKNHGIRVCSGDFIAFIDDDDIWHHEKLQKQICLFKNDKTGLVYTYAEGFDENGKIEISNFEIPKRGMVLNELIKDDFIANSSVVIRRKCVDDVGWFNTNNSCFGVDDFEMWCRVASMYNFDVVEENLTKIRIHDMQFSNNRSKMILADLGVRNQMISQYKIPLSISNRYFSRVYFDMGYLNRQIDKKKALQYYFKSLGKGFKLKTIIAIVKLPICSSQK
jgi:glycosyltransferase involved in cell wall biosynthesis